MTTAGARRHRRHRRLAVTSVIVVGALLSASCASPPVQPTPVIDPAAVGIARGAGFASNDPALLDQEMALVASTGASWIRLDVDWSVIEAERGRYDWRDVDLVVKAARAHDLEVLGLLAYTPSWARPAGTTSHHPPSEPRDFVEFVRAAVEHFVPLSVGTWEIWNEPNVGSFWSPEPDPAAYGLLLQAAAEQVHAIDPEGTVLSGGLAPAQDAPADAEIAPLTFLRALYESGAALAADAIAIHPYSYPALPTDPSTAGYNTFFQLPLVHDLTVEYGDAGVHVWLTEVGAPTGTDPSAVSETDQLTILTEALEQHARWDWTGPLFWYQLRDSGSDLADREQNFGLLRSDDSPKPAFGELQRLLDASVND